MYKVTKEKFEALVNEGLKAIPKRFLEKLSNVAVTADVRPDPERLKARKLKANDLLLGLYEGVPQTNRWEYNLVLPDKITIFQEPIEILAHSEADIRKLVTDTVWHELAHHFGMDEQRVRSAEKRRR
ncbi:MAG: metallopeptidase family protein [Patescibacteria group bacterium]|nr:metallopeptidase family protein [Patescibacteria group bacterium]